MNCQNCEQELANVQEVTEGAQPQAEVTPDAKASAKPSVPYIIAFASVCLLALGYVLMWVSNAFLKGAGVANAGFITYAFGRIAACLVHSAILAPAIVAIIYAYKLYRDSKTELSIRVSKIAILPKLLYFFSAFSCIDMGVSMFLCLLGSSIVGIGNINNNYDIIAEVIDFWGYAGIGIADKVHTMQDGVGAVIVTVLFGFIAFAVSIGNIFVYSKVKNYYDTLVATAEGSQYDKANKPPYIIALVFAGLNVVFAILALVSGVWVEAIIKLALAGYLASHALVFKEVHTELRKTSFE
jgi:hypothetical protein